jgi:hypothetical protein
LRAGQVMGCPGSFFTGSFYHRPFERTSKERTFGRRSSSAARRRHSSRRTHCGGLSERGQASGVGSLSLGFTIRSGERDGAAMSIGLASACSALRVAGRAPEKGDARRISRTEYAGTHPARALSPRTRGQTHPLRPCVRLKPDVAHIRNKRSKIRWTEARPPVRGGVVSAQEGIRRGYRYEAGEASPGPTTRANQPHSPTWLQAGQAEWCGCGVIGPLNHS